MSNIIGSSFESWRATDFNSLLKNLDTIASNIANEKDQSDISRRLLIEKNKKFKDQVSVETRKEIAPLLKCFQTEIDNLNKRNKSFETHLLTIYKKLIDLPDPSNALEIAVKHQKKLQKSQDIALENKKLRETLEEYQQEFSSVKNQEVTLKQLRDRIRELETNMATSIQEERRNAERELAQDFAEKERFLIKDKVEAYYKVDDCERKLAILEKNLIDSQSELFQMKNRFDEFSSAKTAEIELLIDENDRVTERLRQMQSQYPIDSDESLDKDRRQVEMAAIMMRSPHGSIDGVSSRDMIGNFDMEISELHLEISSKDTEIMRLNEEIRGINAQMSARDKEEHSRITLLEQQVQGDGLVIAGLQAKLLSQSDYTEIKKELQIIKSIEFQDCKQSSEDASSTWSADPGSPIHSKSIEQLLSEKNRHLENEFLQLKSSFTQTQIELEKLKEENHENEIKIQEQTQLINQLEDNLRSVKTFQSVTRTSSESAEDPNSLYIGDGRSPTVQLNRANMLADVLEQHDVIGHSSLLGIVQSQRDRFKTRSQELEAASHVSQQTIQNLQQENERIRIDNVKLYEKVRFLQSYSRSSKNSLEDSTMSRYSSEYEANINPFQTFNRSEKQRQFQALPPHEKIVLSLGQLVMGNRTARLIAFLYSLLMHFLIFIVLYKLAYTETCVRDQAFQCRKDYIIIMNHSGTIGLPST